MDNDQETPPGDQGNQELNQSLGWRAALSDQWKEHEFVKDIKKPTDFVEKAWNIKTEHDALKTKLEGAVFKPDDKATPEQVEQFHRTLGKPEKATDYEFPKGEGIEHDPRVIEWAQKTFLAANLSKGQAKIIGPAWDQFVTEMAKADNTAKEKARTDAENVIKAELGKDYSVAVELTKRLLEKHGKPEEVAFLNESGLGNHPVLVRMIFDMAKKTGEDTGIVGARSHGTTPQKGFTYDKSPPPPKN